MLLKEHSQLAAWIAELTATGKLTGIDIMRLGKIPTVDTACQTEAEKRKAERDARYFSPENQLRIYCLPSEEQVEILRESLPEGHRHSLDQYFELWFSQLEASHGSDKSALCKDGKPLPEYERG